MSESSAGAADSTGGGAPFRAEAVVELLGMLAFGELMAFDRMAADARLAPDLRRRALLSEMAAREIANYCRLAERLHQLGVDPGEAMAPYARPLSEYHEQTEPSDWLEGLTKAYVGDGIADDFTREVASVLGSPERELVIEVLHDSRHADFAADEIRAAIAADPKVANRLSMWARRLTGEAISQALRVAGERPALATLLATGLADSVADGGEPGRPTGGRADHPGGIQAMVRRLTTQHAGRMSAVGLNN